jgi:hypothetical protein
MVRDAAKPDSADWLVPPMLLNHVVVGVLLLPLGFLTAYAAPRAAKAVRWALVICRSTSITIAALPPVLFFLMDTRYFAARPFQFAIGIVCTASVALLLATFWPAERLAVDHERSST